MLTSSSVQWFPGKKVICQEAWKEERENEGTLELRGMEKNMQRGADRDEVVWQERGKERRKKKMEMKQKISRWKKCKAEGYREEKGGCNQKAF